MPVTEDLRKKSTVFFRSQSDQNDDDETEVSVFSIKSRPQLPTVFEKRARYFVMLDFKDVTPDFIEDKEMNLQDKTYRHRIFQSKTTLQKELSVNKSKIFISAASKAVIGGISLVANLDNIVTDYTIDTEEGVYSTEDLHCFDQAPSAFYVNKGAEVNTYPPKIKFTLIETETTTLFELPSLSVERGSEEGNLIEQENEAYAYLTVGKGKNRKKINAETQTKTKMTQSKHTQASKPKKKNSIAFASAWEMHDTYEQLKIIEEEVEPEYMVLFHLAPEHVLRKRKKLADKLKRDGVYRTMEELMDNHRFRDAVLITERILACNTFKEQQKKFRGLVNMDPLSMDLKYDYTLEILWQLEHEECADHAVLYCCFNPESPDLFAVAYGKFTFSENKGGLVCIWCMKNPKVPERMYHFDTPVCSLKFSNKHPNWLACGLYDGTVLILDISSYRKKVILCSNRDSNPSFDPIWSVSWNYREHTEYVISVCNDGRVKKFVRTETNGIESSSMMRIAQVEGRIKGVFKIRPCYAFDVRIRRNPVCLCYHPHPKIDHVYFVGTDEGCLHKCSTHYLNQHMDVSRAHSCYVYDIQFSPFWRTLFATCGADWTVQIWVEGIDDSLITLDCVGTVYGISWCPKNSTILVSISRNVLQVWDLSRKVYASSAELRFPQNTVLSYVRFSASGDCVITGDTNGKLYTFFLCDMPIPPFFQKKSLQHAIMRHLETVPHLLHQLEKLETLPK